MFHAVRLLLAASRPRFFWQWFSPMQVSFSHALIFGKDKFVGFQRYTREYFVKDLNSSSGTFVNGWGPAPVHQLIPGLSALATC